MKKRSIGILVVGVCTLLLMACHRQQQPVCLVGNTQGSYFSIKYYDENNVVYADEIQDLLAEIDATVSVFNDSSIISAVNRNDTLVRTNVMFDSIFRFAMQVSENTDGYFDITVGPIVKAWGWWKQTNADVSEQQTDSLLQLVGYRKVRLENGRVIKQDDRMLLDFNAIAQGYSTDLICELLESKGVKNYIVDVGGEVRAKGCKADKQDWIVGIETPAETRDSDRKIQTQLPLRNRAIVTSGNYRKYREVNGKRLSHEIDPKTGYPVSHSLLSVSVIAPTAMEADAYATAFLVMGLEKSMQYLKEHNNLQAFFIYEDEQGNMTTTATEGFFR